MSDYMTEATKAFDGALAAYDRAEEASSERSAQAAMRIYDQRLREAQVMALLSLAQDVRRVADALAASAASDNLTESTRIFGGG